MFLNAALRPAKVILLVFHHVWWLCDVIFGCVVRDEEVHRLQAEGGPPPEPYETLIGSDRKPLLMKVDLQGVESKCQHWAEPIVENRKKKDLAPRASRSPSLSMLKRPRRPTLLVFVRRVHIRDNCIGGWVYS